jgi:benzoyl-CoA reductase/2-hydroxyglutaryl-CoA dehydratase subunit BcrC/BadD/HgdB
MPILDVAENKGYNTDICSYCRVNMGYMELLKQKALTGKTPQVLADSPAADVPLPDLVITCNNICNTLLKWYENLANELHIPLLMIDVPFNHEWPVQKHNKEYIVGEFKHVISQLEEICGRPFDYDKFLEVQKQTQRSVAAWNKIATFLTYKPSPINGFDLFNYMGLIVCARSLDYSEITFNKYVKELEAKLEAKKYAFGDNEKTRVTWEGIAVWIALGHTFKELKGMGSLMTGSAYPGIWDLTYTPGDMESMADAYTHTYINCEIGHRGEVLEQVVSSGKCDGMVVHQNRSCKNMSLLNNAGALYVQKKLDVPFVIFDGDQTDPRNFSEAQFDTRVEALGEMMDAKKGGNQ